MGEFTINNRATSTGEKKVTVNKNITITNYRPNEKGKKPGELTIEVKDGKTNISGTTVDGNRPMKNLRTADLADYKYTVFKELLNLDGNAEDLSETDLSKVSSDMQGIKNVRRDKEAGVTTIVFDNGEILRFDFETDKEKANRVESEAVEKAKKTKEAETSKREKEAKEPKLNTNSTLENIIGSIINLFK